MEARRNYTRRVAQNSRVSCNGSLGARSGERTVHDAKNTLMKPIVTACDLLLWIWHHLSFQSLSFDNCRIGYKGFFCGRWTHTHAQSARELSHRLTENASMPTGLLWVQASLCLFVCLFCLHFHMLTKLGWWAFQYIHVYTVQAVNHLSRGKMYLLL